MSETDDTTPMQNSGASALPMIMALTADAARLMQQADDYYDESTRLTRKASELNAVAFRLHHQARDMFELCSTSMNEVDSLRVQANELREEAETLLGDVNRLYNEASRININANRHYVKVMELQNSAAELLLDCDAMQGLTATLRAKVNGLHAAANETMGRVSRLHIDASALHAVAHEVELAAAQKFDEAIVKDADSNARFEDVKHWFGEVSRLNSEAHQHTSEAESLYKKAGAATEKAARIRRQTKSAHDGQTDGQETHPDGSDI
jgi:chromosome segregation ATPase